MRYPNKDELERAKLTIELLAYPAVIGFIAFVIWRADDWAVAFRDYFGRAGFAVEEFELFGLRIRAQATEALSISEAAITDIEKEYNKVHDLLACSVQQSCSDEQLAQIAALVSAASPEPTAANEARLVISQAIQEVEQIAPPMQQQQVPQVQQAQQQGSTPIEAPGGWIAVTGADRDLEGAQFEKQRIAESFPQTDILLADGWYRTVVRFDSEQEATSSLEPIAAITGRQPYVREFNRWCPAAVDSNEGFIRCGT